MAHLAERETGLDCILWVVNGAIRRKLAVRREMLRHYRSAFGASFYSYLKVLVNFVPMTDEASHQILMHEWIQQFRDFIIEEESGMGSAVEHGVGGGAQSGVCDILVFYLASKSLYGLCFAGHL